MKAVQYFSKEYLAECAKMSVEERLEYLENFRLLMTEAKAPAKATKLISIKMPEDLLRVLKQRALQEGVPYQTLLKRLLRSALLDAAT